MKRSTPFSVFPSSVFPSSVFPSSKLLFSGLLSRYIFREIVVFFLISLGAFTGILFTIRILKFASLIINKGVAASQIATVFISIIPTFLEIAVPLAALLGVMLAFSRLSGDSEIVVMRSSGLSYLNLLAPVLLFGAIAFGGGLIVSHVLKPWGFRTLNETLLSIARSKSAAAMEAGIFNSLGQLTIYSDELDSIAGRLGKVFIDDKRDIKSRKIVVARSGEISSNPELRTINLHLRDGVIHELIQGRYVITDFASNDLGLTSSELTGDPSDRKGRSAREFTDRELSRSEELFKDALVKLQYGIPLDVSALDPLIRPQLMGEELSVKSIDRRITRNRVEMALRTSMPGAAFVLALIAMALGIQPSRTQRTWGAGLSGIAAILVFTMYYAILSLGFALAEARALSPWIAIWMPNIAGLAIAAFMIRQLTTERWSSPVQVLERLAAWIQSRRKVA